MTFRLLNLGIFILNPNLKVMNVFLVGSLSLQK